MKFYVYLKFLEKIRESSKELFLKVDKIRKKEKKKVDIC